MTVPKIKFQPRNLAHQNIELIELDSLYQRAKKLSVNPFEAHRTEFHQLIFIKNGSGKHFVDFKHYAYEAGDFIFINPNQVHAFDDNSRPTGLLILFVKEFLDAITTNIRVPGLETGLFHANNNPVVKVDEVVRQSCEVLLAEIDNIIQDQQDNHLIASLLFTALILKLPTPDPVCDTSQLNDGQKRQFIRFLSLLESSLSFTRNANYYADQLGITYKTLNKICKAGGNQTPKQLIDAQIILEAKRRLVIDQLQISRLAFDLGFDEVSNFVKYFKKHTAMTPNKFRVQMQG